MSLSGNMEVHPSPQSTGGNESVQLDISNSTSEGPDAFGTRDSRKVDPDSSPKANGDAPERMLTRLAVLLAILERIATLLGAMGFIWATVVVLGGFVSMLYKRDFWFVTIIILIEGARISSRSHELEWRQQSKCTITHLVIMLYNLLKKCKRTKEPDTESQKGKRTKEPNTESQKEPAKDKKNNEEKATNLSLIFYWLQLLSASACITLSVVRLVELSHDRVQIDKLNPIMRSALNIFYGLAFVEGCICLLEKFCCERSITSYALLEKVKIEFDLGPSSEDSFRRFFYDVYSECVNKSVFEGWKKDLFSFASKLLVSDSTEEQLIGVQILHKFSTTPLFADEKLQKIGTSMTIIERLVEMLSWKNPDKALIRQNAAEIVSILAGKKHYSLRIVRFAGAMEAISSLLDTQRESDSASDEVDERYGICDKENYEFALKFGLTILHELAADRDNRGKISNTRGLLSKIIECTYIEEWLLRYNHARKDRILTVKQSLRVLKLLAGTSGTLGNNLRQEIAENVFTVTNIREILQFGEKYPELPELQELQLLGIQVITGLAFDVKATEIIGRTGGIIKELFRIFFDQSNSARVAAGEAIAMLALDSETNCSAILKRDDEILTKLVGALEDQDLRINSAKILRYLCKFAGKDCSGKLRGVSAAAPIMLEGIMSKECKLQETMLGLATQVLNIMTSEEANIAFDQVGINGVQLAMKLLLILKMYPRPPIQVPGMRRFAIELAILLIKKEIVAVEFFKAIGMKEEISILRHTTSDIESFNIFSGTLGVSRHGTAIHILVENALQLLADK